MCFDEGRGCWHGGVRDGMKTRMGRRLLMMEMKGRMWCGRIFFVATLHIPLFL